MTRRCDTMLQMSRDWPRPKRDEGGDCCLQRPAPQLRLQICNLGTQLLLFITTCNTVSIYWNCFGCQKNSIFPTVKNTNERIAKGQQTDGNRKAKELQKDKGILPYFLPSVCYPTAILLRSKLSAIRSGFSTQGSTTSINT